MRHNFEILWNPSFWLEFRVGPLNLSWN